MKKLVVVLAVCMVWCSLLVGCNDNDFEEVDGNKEIQVYVDPETGVNYLIYDKYKGGGITVRYNADGSIMVTDTKGV